MSVDIRLTSNIPMAKSKFEAAAKKTLEACGITAEGYAKPSCPVDTGALRNSITHSIDDKTCYVGTNMEYAVYVELGTGIYATTGGGRRTPWVYCDGRGNWHYTQGAKSQPFLKPAIVDHTDKYQDLIKTYFQNG